MLDYARAAAGRGIEVIIAGAGGAAHLPGMVASATPLPVIGVPVPLAQLDGLDSLLSIVQMPAGVPVATVSIGGARNAGLLAVRILAVSDVALRGRMEAFPGPPGTAGARQGRRFARGSTGEGRRFLELFPQPPLEDLPGRRRWGSRRRNGPPVSVCRAVPAR